MKMRGRMFVELKPDQHAGYTFSISSVQVINLINLRNTVPKIHKNIYPRYCKDIYIFIANYEL